MRVPAVSQKLPSAQCPRAELESTAFGAMGPEVRPFRRARSLMLALLVLFALAACASGGQRPAGSGVAAAKPEAVVQGYEAAFNAHSPDQVGRWLHEDLRWLAIEGDQVRMEAQGRAAMLAWLRGYFQQFPDVSAQIRSFHGGGRHVAVHECLSWTHEGQRRRQCAHGTYEIEDGLIRRVWYWPVDRE